MALFGIKYKCEICGNLVEVLESGESEIFCCGEPMVVQYAKWNPEKK